MNHVARMIFELEDTPHIVNERTRLAEERRAGRDDEEAGRQELVTCFLAIMDEAMRMALAHVAAAATRLSEALTAMDLERHDRPRNFQIQELMSDFTQAETLASSVLKKRDCTGSAVIGKI